LVSNPVEDPIVPPSFPIDLTTGKCRGSFGHEPLLAFPRPEGLGTFFLIILPAPVFIMSLNSGVMVLVNGSVGDPSLIPPPQPEIVEPKNTRTSNETARFIDVNLWEKL
jgi:hypothetical protein